MRFRSFLDAAWGAVRGVLSWLSLATTPPTPKYRAFISYARRDQGIVKQLRKKLRKALGNPPPFHIDFVYDVKSLNASEDYVQRIPELIESSDIIILAITPRFVASPFIRKTEINLIAQMHARKVPVAPVFIEKADLRSLPHAKTLVRLGGLNDPAIPVVLKGARSANWTGIGAKFKTLVQAHHSDSRRQFALIGVGIIASSLIITGYFAKAGLVKALETIPRSAWISMEVARSRGLDWRWNIPRLGLECIGTDPATRRWEFWAPSTGAEPLRDGGVGKLNQYATTGMVFVLIEGGGRLIGGAQRDDPRAPNYLRTNAYVKDIEYLPPADPNTVLPPLLVSKYELTRHQLARLTGHQLPSRNGGHPATALTRGPLDRLLELWQLDLPDEYEWEHLCRCSSSSFDWWSTGNNVYSLWEHANLDHVFSSQQDIAVQPVGQRATNGFGLHDVHGNVKELCWDPTAEPRARLMPRGGGFRSSPWQALIVAREKDVEGDRIDDDIGVRLVIRLTAE